MVLKELLLSFFREASRSPKKTFRLTWEYLIPI